jgi:tRNA threonylcarbamoyladenosine biosynthesis protein TsaE
MDKGNSAFQYTASDLPELRVNLTLPDPDATDNLGRALGEAFPGAVASPLVLHLNGELGTGKTSCARGLLHRLGVAGNVRSPTYTLLEIYALPALTCVHADLYRLRSQAEFVHLGLSEYLLPAHLILIEWSANGGPLVPAADITLDLSYAGSGRAASLRSGSASGEAWLKDLARDTRLSAYLSNLT